MKTVKDKTSDRYGIAFFHEDGMIADMYIDLLWTVKQCKGTYDAPHLKLLLDMHDIDFDDQKEKTVAV